ncbi:hypothetical protein [Streptomyces sp. NPDC101206]|uniref:phage tail protein n=1 Tax=Streptomyces sp. NPDC101206 TaxID=3366128 RepID=UPI0038231388
MAQTIGELVAIIRGDSSDLERSLARSELEMEGFSVDAGGRLRTLSGRFVTESAVMGTALRRVTEATEEVGDATGDTSEDVDRHTRTMSDRFRAVAEAGRRMGSTLGEHFGRMRQGLGGISIDTDRLQAVGARFAGIAMSVGKVAAALGGAVPLVAGLVSSLAQMAPAAGVAVTGLFGVVLATQAIKLGMKGVGDAVSAAMDPSDPEAYAEALKKLSPNARSFVEEVRKLQPEFKALQKSVQDGLFEDLDGIMVALGHDTLPILKTQLTEAGRSMGFMAQGVGNAAIELSQSGTLGKALDGANEGLANLSQIPGQLVTALTQVGAAAAPAFARLTAAGGSAVDRLSAKIAAAFDSGGMQRGIEQAIALVGQFGRILGNVGSILGGFFGAAQASGGGFLSTLEQVTGALAKAFKDPSIQAGLSSLFDTMAKVGQTVAPLLGTALKAIAPVLTALGPPIQRLVATLGAALGPIIAALGPVLESAATAVGALLDAVSPLLPVVSQLLVGLLMPLAPVLGLVAGIFKQLAPLVGAVAGMLSAALAPVLTALMAVIQPILGALGQLVSAVLPILMVTVTALSPVITQLAGTFAELLVALAPVIAQLIVLAARVLTMLAPLIITTVSLVGRLATAFAGELGRVVTGIVIPALTAIVALLRGDFSGAWQATKALVVGVVEAMVRLFVSLPGRAGAALASLGSVLGAKISEAGAQMIAGARARIDTLIGHIRSIRDLARGALSGLGSVLWSAGASLIGGLIDGVQSKVGALKAKLSSITSMLPDWKGPAERDAKILTPAGRLLMDGFMRGIQDRVPDLRGQLGSLTGGLPGMTLGASGAGGGVAGMGPGRLVIEVTGPDEVKSFIRKIVAVDGRGDVQVAFG